MANATQKLEDGAESVGRGVGYAEEALEGAKAVAAEAADKVATAARQAIDNPQKFAEESFTSVSAYVRDKPLEAMAIGAGIGFVIGALWKK